MGMTLPVLINDLIRNTECLYVLIGPRNDPYNPRFCSGSRSCPLFSDCVGQLRSPFIQVMQFNNQSRDEHNKAVSEKERANAVARLVFQEADEHLLCPVESLEGTFSSQPSLASLTDSDSSSIAESSIQSLTELCPLPKESHKQRRISFANVMVREYAVTLGDHPYCSDGVALSLDWECTDEHIQGIEDSQERTEKYRFPRRLSYQERRDRICGSALSPRIFCASNACDGPRDINAVIEMLQKSWNQTRLLPAPDLFDIEDIEDTTEQGAEIEQPCSSSMVFQWKRNCGPPRRSQSFCE